MKVQSFPNTTKEVQADFSNDTLALLKPNSSARVQQSSVKAGSKSGVRRLRTETFYQKNIDDVQSIPDSSKSYKPTESTERRDRRPPQQIDIVVAIVVLAKLEMILINLDDQKLKPINAEIAGLRCEVLSLQQQLSENGKLIEKLQTEVGLNQGLQIQLDAALKNNERLLGELSNRFNQHDDLIRRLEEGVLKNAAISQELKEAILENKKAIETLQNTVHDIDDIQNILIKYGNNSEGLPPLHAAIKKGDKEAVEILLKHGANPNSRGSLNGFTGLHQAIESNQLEIARLLIASGADLNAEFQEGCRRSKTIDLALQIGNRQMLDLLIGIDSNVFQEIVVNHLIEATKNKANPIELAFKKNDLKLAEYFLQMREKDGSSTFDHPGYQFRCSWENWEMPPNINRGGLAGEHPIWYKPAAYRSLNGWGCETWDMEYRVNVEAIQLLMKYDSKNLWKQHVREWFEKSYRLGDLETLIYLYQLDPLNPARHGGDGARGPRYLVDPFLSDFPLDKKNINHFYDGGNPRREIPILWAYRPDDNIQIRELKRQLQELSHCG